MTANERLTAVELAGFEMDSPIQTGRVWAPRARAHPVDGFLVYHVGERVSTVPPPLEHFLNLAEASDEWVARFCRKWGVLCLCAHGFPWGHHACKPGPFPNEEKATWRESIEHIRRFSRACGALLAIGAQLSQGKSADACEWQTADALVNGADFTPMKDDAIAPWNHRNLNWARLNLQTFIRRLLKISDVRPRFYWNHKAKSWQIDLDAAESLSNLPGIIAIQVMVTIASRPFAICSNCQRSYIPEKRPDPTRRSYCFRDGCKRASRRDAQRDCRERKRAGMKNGETRK
jgi:hypothetical protein